MPSLLDATPEELQALRQIAQLRAAGISDQDIYSRMANTQAGGYGLLPSVVDLAGITSSYNLGRGQLAAGQQEFGYNLMARPYNVVAANQYYADQQGTPGLTDPTLGNVPASPMSRYQQYIDSILFPGESGVTGTAPQTVAAPTGTPSGPWGFESPEQAQEYFRRVNNPPMTAFSPVPAQQTSARQLGAQLPGMQSPQFGNTLARGEIPGLSSLNEAEVGRLTPDQRAQWMGLISSTGRVSDPEAAFADFQRKYSTRGAQAAGTYR